MFKTILKEFKNAPLGTTSACVGLTALPSAPGGIGSFRAAEHQSSSPGALVAGIAHLHRRRRGARVCNVRISSGTNTGRLSHFSRMFSTLGSSVAIVAASAVFGGSFNAAWRMVLIVIGLPAWLLFAAIVVERDQIQRRETIMPGPSKATRPSVFNFVEHPDFQWAAIMFVGLLIGGAASVFTWRRW